MRSAELILNNYNIEDMKSFTEEWYKDMLNFKKIFRDFTKENNNVSMQSILKNQNEASDLFIHVSIGDAIDPRTPILQSEAESLNIW